MNREDVKAAADALGRLEALEAAHASAERAPHDALPISFFDMGDENDDYKSDYGIKAYYPRRHYITTISYMIAHERAYLESIGIDLGPEDELP